MGKIINVAFALFIFATTASGQSSYWTRVFGGSGTEYGYSVQQTSDGGYIITGSTTSFGAGLQDVYLIKTDADGCQIWQRLFNRNDYDIGRCVRQTSDGGYIIAGYTSNFGQNYYVYLIKTDNDGNQLWERTFSGNDSRGYSVQQTSDGGYVIVGYTIPVIPGYAEVYIIKTDSDGYILWQRTLGGSMADNGQSVQQTSDGGYIICGMTDPGHPDYADVYLIKTDNSGILLWERTFGGNFRDYSYCVQETSDGGYIITGNTLISVLGSQYVYLIKTDSDGNQLWDITFGGNGDDRGYSVRQTSDGGYIISGSTNSYGAGEDDLYLLKTDIDGNLLWERTFGGSDCEIAGRDVQQTSDGGYIIIGTTLSFGAGGADVYLIKTDSEGYTGIETPDETMNPIHVILPNPSPTEVVLTLNMASSGIVEAHMFDVSGRLVDSWMGTGIRGEQSITLTAPLQGIHFIRLETPEGECSFSTVVIN